MQSERSRALSRLVEGSPCPSVGLQGISSTLRDQSALADSVPSIAVVNSICMPYPRTSGTKPLFPHREDLPRESSRALPDRPQRRRRPRQSRPRRLRRRNPGSVRKKSRPPQRIPRPPDQQFRRVSGPDRGPRIRHPARPQSAQADQRFRAAGPPDQRHLQSEERHAAGSPRPRQRIDRPTGMVLDRPRLPRAQLRKPTAWPTKPWTKAWDDVGAPVGTSVRRIEPTRISESVAAGRTHDSNAYQTAS